MYVYIKYSLIFSNFLNIFLCIFRYDDGDSDDYAFALKLIKIDYFKSIFYDKLSPRATSKKLSQNRIQHCNNQM